LFVGSGKALAAGGPASLLIAFALIGTMLYCTVHALGEMAVLFPVAGSGILTALGPCLGFRDGVELCYNGSSCCLWKLSLHRSR
jgi:amino acid permease